jgi:hypothetical protein
LALKLNSKCHLVGTAASIRVEEKEEMDDESDVDENDVEDNEGPIDGAEVVVHRPAGGRDIGSKNFRREEQHGNGQILHDASYCTMLTS